MPRRLLSLLLFILPFTCAEGQVRGILGFPDRVMSSSRISRASSREVPQKPASDTSRVSFSEYGTRYISDDYDFFGYLADNDLKQDAMTLVSGGYFPSDTLDYLRAKILFTERKFGQASELFSKVPAASVFGPESFHYDIVALSNLGEYGRASELLSSGGSYPELTSLQGAGLALLREDKDDWPRYSSGFTYSDHALAESERILSEIGASRFDSRGKHAGLAALASAVIPGAGKVYAGRLGEGVAAFLTVGSLGAITAENWKKHGLRDWRTIVAGSLCATFYLGNIYGSYMSVSIEKDERENAENMVILYHLHLPLRSVFR